MAEVSLDTLMKEAGGTMAPANTMRTATTSAAGLMSAGQALLSSRSRRRGTGVIAIGDSIVLGYPATGSAPCATDRTLAPGWFHQACVQSGGALRYVDNAGVSGNTSTQVLARLSTDVVALSPDYCIVAVGENDEGNSIALATTLTNLAAIYSALELAGIEVVACTVLGKSTSSPAISTIAKINAFVRSKSQERGYHLLDFASFMLDASTGACAYTSDGTHPTPTGYKLMADYAVAQLAPRLVSAPPPLAVVNSGDHNLITNPCFLTDTNSDGIPDGWSVAVGGTGTYTLSIGAAPTGSRGNFWKIAFTSATAYRGYKFDISSGFSAGDKVVLSMRCKAVVESGGGSYQIGITCGTVTNKIRLYYWAIDVDGVIYLPFTVPTGATSLSVVFYAGGTTTVSGEVSIGQVLLRNLTVLGLTS